MVRLGMRSFFSELQRRLNADLERQNRRDRVVVTGADLLQVTEHDIAAAPAALCFGPYGATPLCGLRFDTPDGDDRETCC